ncbi:serine hydrolase domain-containing protein [Sphingomonas hankyongi]|uniref:Beta-lactamase family protein n=1 Tax=Sphingomonas hankyongi TaxID=2908209 RepID=A0ABT0S053_9SPHN|nr:serine hydrolase domain-containing protein [Sphingomonas hankyongi]MCL6729217.1 beta-lactamase family protein [Sphingomonas hankyongi]
MKRGTLIGISIIVTAAPWQAAATPSDSVVRQVRSRADKAAFEGAILIGEKDGSRSVLTLGKNPVQPGAIWRWASITKQLTAVLAMQEVARGRLDLDAPVSRYWPDWKAPAASRIRIRDLLLHNSGLPQPDESKADPDGVPAFYRSGAVAPAISAGAFCAGKPRAEPPAKFEYNNCDSIVLAEVLARVTGKPFARLLQERLSEPLGMRSVGIFRVDQPAASHVRPNGEFSKEDALLNLGVYGASGGAYGTIADLWKFDHALLGGRLLPRSARETMWKSDKSNGFYGFHQWIYPSSLKGCGKPVRIVERQGLVGGIELRNYLLPESGRGLIMFSRHRPTNLGDPWENKGFAFDLLSAVACRR